MTELEVINLTKKYDAFTAVDNLSFAIESGKIYGFLGPNGAGKSTTMNMITGCLAPTDGTVRIEGFDILEDPKNAKKHIGYLPELPPVYPDMTPSEYLGFVCEIKDIPKKQIPAMTADVMKKTDIFAVKDRLIGQLSKGYRQRVGIAQAIAGYPGLIILDEPTVGLDPAQIIEIRELIRELGKEHTVILSSHILSEVSELCDEVLIINKGKFIARDKPERLAEQANERTRLSMKIEGSEESIKTAFSLNTDIYDFSIENSEGELKTVTANIKKDAYNSVFYTLADARLPIHEMNSDKKSLEEVFIELTSNKEAEK